MKCSKLRSLSASWSNRVLAGVGLAALFLGSAHATPPMAAPPVASDSNDSGTPGKTDQAESYDLINGLRRSQFLLGNMGGLRPLMSKYGLSLNILETSEGLGNVTGGAQKGFNYDGLTQMVLQMDTQRAFGLYGGTFNVSGLQIHGSNLSAHNLLTLQTASGIESDRASRLWELWYQQKFLPEDRLDVKIGQQSLDQEFMVSQNALLFVNTMFGWPMLPSADLPGGGPAYPLSAPGIRFRWRPFNSVSILAGVFNGSPILHNNAEDSQKDNSTGTSFPLNNGMLAIVELQYVHPALGGMVYSDKAQPLAGVYKIGMWYDTDTFGDQEFDNTGVSLASGASSGIAATHRGNYAIYGVMDQMIWRDPHDEDGDRSISFFTRVMGAPQEDRNLIDFSLNAGFTFREPFVHRDDDSFGIGIAFTKVGDHASGFDRDNGILNGGFAPVRGTETILETTYQIQITPWWQVQPDIQYAFNPGGGIENPNALGSKVKDEFVFGLRTNIQF